MSPKAPVTGRHLGLLNLVMPHSPCLAGLGHPASGPPCGWEALCFKLPCVGLKGAKRQHSGAVTAVPGCRARHCASPRVCRAGSQAGADGAGAMAGRTVAETRTEGSAVRVQDIADNPAAWSQAPSLGRQWLQHWKCQCIQFPV